MSEKRFYVLKIKRFVANGLSDYKKTVVKEFNEREKAELFISQHPKDEFEIREVPAQGGTE